MATLKDIDFEAGGTLASVGFTGNIDVVNQLNNYTAIGNGGGRAMSSVSGVLLGAILGVGSQGREGSATFDYYHNGLFGASQRIFDTTFNSTQGVVFEVTSALALVVKSSSAGSTLATIAGAITASAYTTLEARWRLSSFGNSDGELRVLVNGVQVFSLSNWASDVDDDWNTVRFQVYADSRIDNVFVTDALGVEGGVGEEPDFSNAILTIGITWIIVTLRSGLQYVWSDRPLPDPETYYLGWKAPKVIRWGKIRRALSHVLDGQYETSDFKVLLSDTDRLLRQLDADAELVNATVAVYMISDAGRRALETARTVYRGVIRDARPLGTLQYELTIKDTFAEQFSATNETNLIPRRVVTTTDFPNAAQTLVKSSAEGYLVNGAVAAGEADVPVDTGWGIFAEGDHVTFGAGTDVYTVVSMSSQFVTPGGNTETYISVDPVVIGGLANNAAVNVIASHEVEPSVGKRVPIVYGNITDLVLDGGVDQGDGQGPVIYVGDEQLPDGKSYAKFIISGHACYSPSNRPIQDLYFWNESVDNYGNGIYFPDIGTLSTEAGVGGRICIPGYGNWTTTNGFTTNYEDINGRRYTVIYLRGIFKNWALGLTPAPINLGGTPFAANYYGIEDVGDSSGALITDGLEQYKHTVKNWCPPKGLGYQSGAWLSSPVFADDPTLPMIDEDSFDLAHAQSEVYVTDGFRGDFIIGANDEAIAARDLIARFNLSFGVECGFNRKTQFFVTMVNTDIGSTTLNATLDYIRDIFSGTFQIEPLTRELFTALRYFHTQDYIGRAVGGWRSITTGVVETENTTATTTYGSKTTYDAMRYYMIRGNNRASDPTDYDRGTDTAAAVLALQLTRLSAIQHIVQYQTGPGGFTDELGDVVPITHYEGLSTTGWTERPIRIERVEVDPSDFTTTNEGYDLDPMVS